MTPVNRDLQIVTLVARFDQLTARHINGVVFATNLSDTPCDRALTRLVERKYLMRFPRRHLPVNRSGSAECVYQVGKNGWDYIGYPGAFSQLTSITAHRLAIADLHLRLFQFERGGVIEVDDDYMVEPEVFAGGIELEPDMHARITDMRDGKAARFFFEVDLGTENVNQIKKKVQRYCNAYRKTNGLDERWRYFPRVIFVVRDEYRGDTPKRCAFIERWIEEAADVPDLFRVCTFDSVVTTILA